MKKKSISKKRLNLDRHLEILETFNHAASGAQLIHARIKNPAREDRAYVTAWLAPWQKTTTQYLLFNREHNSHKAFQLQSKGNLPASSVLRQDWQVEKVYEWQGDNINKGTARLSEEQMKRVIAQVSRDFNIAAPRLCRCHADPGTAAGEVESTYHNDPEAGPVITMRHKDYALLLHELAHAIDVKINGNEDKWADHGPSFVRTLIELAEKYHWCDAVELEQSAIEAGIMVAPRDSLPLPPKPSP